MLCNARSLVLAFTLFSPPLVAQEFGLAPLGSEVVELSEGAWRERVVLLQERVLPDLLARFEEERYLANLEAAAAGRGEHNGVREADAEVLRWIEAAALSLDTRRSEALEREVARVVKLVLAAQEDDGYLQTWYQLERPKLRFREVDESLELYTVGAFVRAGLAWRAASADATLYEGSLRAAKLVAARVEARELRQPPGFPGLEGALVELADATGDEAWADLALTLIEWRGDPRRSKRYGPEKQDSVPLLEERLAVGHAERGLALYAAVAEVARTRGYEDYWVTTQTLWDDITRRKSYVTGGVGADAKREAFGLPFDLPQETAWCSTAAAASVIDLDQSLLLATGHAVGADGVERALYNALLVGLALDGTASFHDNALRAEPGTRRVERPSTTRSLTALARRIATVESLIYARGPRDLYLAQFISSRAQVPLEGGVVHVELETDYPRAGLVELRVDPPHPMAFTLHVRIPGWCTEAVTLGANDVLQDIKVTHGHDAGTWLDFERTWKAGDTFTLQLPLVGKLIEAHPEVEAQEGRVALRRGPEVYVVEGLDNDGQVADLFVPRGATVESYFDEGLLGGVQVLEAQGGRVRRDDGRVSFEPWPVRAVPYFLWGNREPSSMSVWIADSPEGTRAAAAAGGGLASGRVVQASHVNRHTRLAAVSDGVMPRDSRDELVPRATFEPHAGSEEWLRYDFGKSRGVDRAAVYWFDQGPGGACRAPRSWRVQWLDGERWRDVSAPLSAHRVELDQLNEVRFEPVVTPSLRILVQLRPGASAGVLEWTVGRTGE